MNVRKATLFIIDPSWKKPKYPVTSRWLNQLDTAKYGIPLINKRAWSVYSCSNLDGPQENDAQ